MLTIACGLCSILSGMLTAIVAFQGWDDPYDTDFDRVAKPALLALWTAVATGAIGGGVVAVLSVFR